MTATPHAGMTCTFSSGCRDLNPGPLDPQSCRARWRRVTVRGAAGETVPSTRYYLGRRVAARCRPWPCPTTYAGRMVLKVVLKNGPLVEHQPLHREGPSPNCRGRPRPARRRTETH